MITKIFCEIDDFIKDWKKEESKISIGKDYVKLKSRLSLSEVMTILEAELSKIIIRKLFKK
jgi:hypothetical protein